MSPAPLVAPLLLLMMTSVVPSLLESCAPVMSPPDAAIVKSVGSINQEPIAPLAAVVSTSACATFAVVPDVSTDPPFPPAGPPFAEICPATVVAPFDQTVT